MLDVASDPVIGRLSSVVDRIAHQHNLHHEIRPCDHLVDCGMTSIAMVELMLGIEAEFDMTLPQKELTPANFRSIKSLKHMISRLGAA